MATPVPVDPRAPRWLRGIFWANLVAQMAIVVTGGVVRLTGSGLGCPTWPECVEGSYVPTSRQEEAWHKYVEFGNRTLTFVLGILAIAAIVGALLWWRRSRRTPVLLLAALPLLGTVAQAVLGGITVLTGLNPWVVAAHFLLSIGIIAGCVVLVGRSGETGDLPVTPLVRPEVRWLGRVLVLVTFAVVVLGTIVTGSGPHSGDADTEARFGLDPRTVSWLHADVVLLFLGLTVGMIIALRVTDGPPRARSLAWALLLVSIGQGVIGYSQYFAGLPWALVAVHMLGATVVWVVAVFLLLSLRTRGSAGVPGA
ncbi:MAG: COX15/CtaA family protein [Candidatus Nanopelagicales bacterium]